MTASGLASDSLLAALLSVTAVVIFLAVALWIAVKRPGLGMIFFFVLFAFAWRLVSVLYIDLFGPLFSDQLARDIGPGISAVADCDFAGDCHHRDAVFVSTAAGAAAHRPGRSWG